jgi:hypothetical protein
LLHSDDDAACRILVRFTPLIGDALNRDQTFYFIERIRFILRQGDFKVWCAMLEWNRSQSRSFDAVVIELAPANTTKAFGASKILAGLLRRLKRPSHRMRKARLARVRF